MSRLKIGIITVNLNNKDGLLKTIESVVNQEGLTFEFIVVDGDSQDGSKEVIRQFETKITHAISEKDTGIYNAMNKGIKISEAEFLLFLNSGDYLAGKDVLANVSAHLKNQDVVYGDIITRDISGNQKHERSPDTLDARYFMQATVWHPSAFVQRALFQRIGNYNEDYKIASDYDFFLRAVVKHKISFKHINLPIAIFELNGLSNNPKYFQMMLNEREKIQQSWFDQSQLAETKVLEIQTVGRNSRFFKYVPGSDRIKKMYDAFYYKWYKWRIHR